MMKTIMNKETIFKLASHMDSSVWSIHSYNTSSFHITCAEMKNYGPVMDRENWLRQAEKIRNQLMAFDTNIGEIINADSK